MKLRYGEKKNLKISLFSDDLNQLFHKGNWRERMIFLKMYCGFCIITFILMELRICEEIQKAKRKYADKIKENRNKSKANLIETLCVHIRIFITCFVPIINLGMFWSVLFNGIQVQENAMKKVDDAIKKSEQ